MVAVLVLEETSTLAATLVVSMVVKEVDSVVASLVV